MSNLKITFLSSYSKEKVLINLTGHFPTILPQQLKYPKVMSITKKQLKF